MDASQFSLIDLHVVPFDVFVDSAGAQSQYTLTRKTMPMLACSPVIGSAGTTASAP